LMRNAMSTAGIPAEIGASLMNEGQRVAERVGYAKMTVEQQSAFAETEKAKLVKLWGDGASAKFALARQLLNELDAKHPGIRDLADRSGITSSAMGVSLLVQQAERLTRRK